MSITRSTALPACGREHHPIVDSTPGLPADYIPPRELKVGDLAVKKIWSDQDLSEFSKVNLIGQI